MAIENKVLNTRIKLKRDTSANWTSNNPVLLNGEIIIVDTAEGEVRFKIGDGSKTYTQLPFEDEGIRNLIADKSKVVVETWLDSSEPTAQFLSELVINKVKDRETYEAMVDAGKVDINELYFIEEDDELEIITHTTTGTKIATIKIGANETDIYAPEGGITEIIVQNDYVEYREGTEDFEPGRVICENGDDTLSLATERLQPGANVVSDTFGFAIGETETAKTPIAVSGRVLVYPYEDRNSYKPGDAVCAAPGGTVSKMTREEIREYPERILGTVSAIPTYEVWGEGKAKVNGRIWIKVR